MSFHSFVVVVGDVRVLDITSFDFFMIFGVSFGDPFLAHFVTLSVLKNRPLQKTILPSATSGCFGLTGRAQRSYLAKAK